MKLLDELKLCGDWYDALADYHSLLNELDMFLLKEESSYLVLPKRGERLNALKSTSFSNVSVLLLGQDPYPKLENKIPHAMGLSFSVNDGIKPPRSLNNIYKELFYDLGLPHPGHGNLLPWAKDGVCLLNSVLTLRQGVSNSHAKKGWETFTSGIIDCINKKKEHVVFLSWGGSSHKLMKDIFQDRHLVIKTSHPSPLGNKKTGIDFISFEHSKCFSTTNEFLKKHGIREIDWNLNRD
jgi:Uracil DNA glycosylase